MSKDTNYIPSLDGIRAMSFGVVFLAHAGLSWVPGGFGVTVFFFLSGFLITTLMRRELTRTGNVSLKNFYLRRALRILPPFYLILAAAVTLSAFGISGSGFDPRAVTAQALHYANYWIAFNGFGGFPPGTGVYWSLAVEEHFYLLFPWLYLALNRAQASRERQAVILLGLCALILCWRCVLVYALGASADRTSVSSETRFDSILFGCALAIGENPVLDATRVREAVWKYVLFPAGVVILLVSFAVRDPGFRESVRYTAQGLALIPVFVCAMRYPSWLPMRPLNFRPIAFVGVLSYTLYLVHQVILSCLSHGALKLGLVPGSLLALVLSLLVAYAVYALIEKPLARLRRRLHA